MQIISSKDNEIIKNIRKLKEKKYRDIENSYIIEGIKLIKEAIEEKAVIKQIVMCEEFSDEEIDKDTMFELARHNLVYVTKSVFNIITDVKTPQGIIAVLEKKKNEDANYKEDIIIALDDIQDPGNLGTILRTIDSANLKQIIVSKNTVDVYNPKVVRSTMGAIFRINVVEAENLKDELENAKKHGYKVMVTSLDSKKNIYNVDYNKKVIVIGNEAKGVSKEIKEIADEKVIIPMLGKTESLNASVATSIMVYEYVRRKISK